MTSSRRERRLQRRHALIVAIVLPGERDVDTNAELLVVVDGGDILRAREISDALRV